MTTPTTGPAEELVAAGFAYEVGDAPELHHGLNLADIAHVLVLRERGLLPDATMVPLLRLLLETHRRPVDDFPYDPAYGEVYNCRERHFVARLGDDAGWLHAGRPRREAVRVALRLRLREITADLVCATAGLVIALADRAAEHAETCMADQTYLQQAQPSTLGHYLLSFAYPTLRDGRRALAALDDINRSPGGAGCANGSGLQLDRGRVADLLGFDGIIEHTRDAMWQTDGLIDVTATAASLVAGADKLAEDLEIWSSQEFDYVSLAAPYTRASVLMPQKRNPYALSVVRGSTGLLIGRLTGLLAVTKSPSARSDNLIFSYGDIPRALTQARRVVELMRGVVATLEVHADRMWSALISGFTQATDLAEFVMQRCEVDYRTAYLIVGRAVQTAAVTGLRGVDLTGEMLDAASVEHHGDALGLAGSDLSAVLDPRRLVADRLVPGGAAPRLVRQMADTVRSQAKQLDRGVSERRARMQAAEQALLRRAELVIADG
ncbi:MAG TPA: argininosuccinate lyase [Euzebyales bacterium]|nr:argininosuccinate lyase [Euzebyales bacterium]